MRSTMTRKATMVFKIMLLTAIIFLTSSLIAFERVPLVPKVIAQAADLENPTGPDDYAAGFFGLDLTNFSGTTITNWINPGDRFCRVKFATNCDGSTATPTEITNAINAWNGFTQCQRWALRLHHEALVRAKHTTLEVWVYYFTGIPVAKKAQIVNCLNLDELYYLGDTYTAAKNKVIELKSEAFWLNIFPNDALNTVVFGWESAAE